MVFTFPQFVFLSCTREASSCSNLFGLVGLLCLSVFLLAMDSMSVPKKGEIIEKFRFKRTIKRQLNITAVAYPMHVRPRRLSTIHLSSLDKHCGLPLKSGLLAINAHVSTCTCMLSQYCSALSRLQNGRTSGSQEFRSGAQHICLACHKFPSKSPKVSLERRASGYGK